MRFLSKLIAFAVIVIAFAACSREARNGVDSQVENDERNGIGAAGNQPAEAGTDSRNDNDSVAQSSPGKLTSLQQRNGNTDFVIDAADGGLLEVRLAELAKTNGASPDVKEFARTMTIDHGKANNELKNLAKSLNISIPTSLSEKSQEKYDSLVQKKGADFDKAYGKMMVTSHVETIEMFRAEAKNGERQGVREWAGAKLPNLEHHLGMAQNIHNSATASKGQ